MPSEPMTRGIRWTTLPSLLTIILIVAGLATLVFSLAPLLFPLLLVGSSQYFVQHVLEIVVSILIGGAMARSGFYALRLRTTDPISGATKLLIGYGTAAAAMALFASFSPVALVAYVGLGVALLWLIGVVRKQDPATVTALAQQIVAALPGHAWVLIVVAAVSLYTSVYPALYPESTTTCIGVYCAEGTVFAVVATIGLVLLGIGLTISSVSLYKQGLRRSLTALMFATFCFVAGTVPAAFSATALVDRCVTHPGAATLPTDEEFFHYSDTYADDYIPDPDAVLYRVEERGGYFSEKERVDTPKTWHLNSVRVFEAPRNPDTPPAYGGKVYVPETISSRELTDLEATYWQECRSEDAASMSFSQLQGLGNAILFSVNGVLFIWLLARLRRFAEAK